MTEQLLRQLSDLTASTDLQCQRGKLRNRRDALSAIERISEVVSALVGSSVTSRDRITIAGAYRVKGEVYLGLAMVDEANDEFTRAEALFVQAGGDSEEYGRFLHDYSVTLAQFYIRGAALEYANRARTVLAPFGKRYARDLDDWIARLSSIQSPSEQGSGAEPVVPLPKRGLLRSLSGRDRATEAQNKAVQLLNHSPDPHAHVDEIAKCTEIAFKYFSRNGAVEEATLVLLTMLDMYWKGLVIPPWALDATTATLAQAEASDRSDLVADVLAVRAASLDQRGAQQEALDVALRAIARQDEHMLATETSYFRMTMRHTADIARELGLQIAIAAQDGALAAELIESSRLQVEPGDFDPDDEREATRRSGIRGLRPVSVHGTSRLMNRYRPGIAGPPVSLDAAITAVGGRQASWWGTWAINERIYWALFIDHRWTCGVLNMSEGTELRSLILRVFDESAHNPKATLLDLITGAWSRNVAAEEMLSLDLGQALIPAQLRERLIETAGISPISLVIAGNFAGIPPLPLLAMGGDLFSKPIWLVEAAILRVAPPAILVERAMRAEGSTGKRHPIRVACVDPTNNLDYAGEIPESAEVKLSGNPASNLPLASLGELKKAVEGAVPGAPGLFYYSGHATSNNFSDDEDALALSGNTSLSARLLFSSEGEAFTLPARAMISACDTSGARSGGSGEWLGLSAALMWRGCRQVIATNWKIWDTPFTSAFDLRLAERLQTAEDPAAALREAQIEALNKWRFSNHDFTEYADGERLPSRAASLAFPLIWASYCCVGVRD